MPDSKTKFIYEDLLRHPVKISLSTTIRLSVVSEMVGSLLPLSRFNPSPTVSAYATACETSFDFTDVYGLAIVLFHCRCNHYPELSGPELSNHVSARDSPPTL